MPSQSPSSQDQLTFPWQDSERPIEARVELLLGEMSLEEKVAQLGSRWVGNDSPESGGAVISPEAPETNTSEALNVAPMQDGFAAAGSPSQEEASRHGLGHLTRVYGSAPITAVEGAKELVRQQRVVLDSSRLRIPALVHAEVSFRVDADRTAFTDRDLLRIVEAGEVDILVGRSASDLPCQARILLTGPTRVVDHKDA